jgi:hypothetical protein
VSHTLRLDLRHVDGQWANVGDRLDECFPGVYPETLRAGQDHWLVIPELGVRVLVWRYPEGGTAWAVKDINMGPDLACEASHTWSREAALWGAMRWIATHL